MKKLTALVLALVLMMSISIIPAQAGSYWDTTPRSTWCTFSEYGMTSNSITVSGLVWKYKDRASNNSSKTNNNASATQVANTIRNGGSYGINYKITAKLSGSVNLDMKVVIVSPNGYEMTVNFGSVTFSSRYRYVWSEFMGSEFFTQLYQLTGNIPSGDYQLFLYLDYQLADYSTLYLR